MSQIMRAAAVAVSLLASGCASKYQALTPELQASMLADLQAGKMTLDCKAGCTLSWLAAAPTIHQIDLAEKWDDLAVHVMQIGYGNDLAYYYLGQAAQGLGYHQAAIAYYSYAFGLNTGPNTMAKCATLQSAGSDPCQGVDLASSIPVLVQASRDAIAQQQAAADAAAQASAAPAPVRHHRHHATPVSSTAAASTAGSGWTAPPPPSAPSAGSPGWVAPPPPPAQ